MLRLLVSRGADPQQRSSLGRRPLEFAEQREDVQEEQGQQIVEFLKLGNAKNCKKKVLVSEFWNFFLLLGWLIVVCCGSC